MDYLTVRLIHIATACISIGLFAARGAMLWAASTGAAGVGCASCRICRDQLAVYKLPRLIEFVASLPKSGSGKLMWRELQEQQVARDAQERRKKDR